VDKRGTSVKFLHHCKLKQKEDLYKQKEDLLIGNSISIKQAEISQHTGQFYQKLYTEQCS
jgi:hypothetical protein